MAENEKSAPEGSIISSSSCPRFIFLDAKRRLTSDERNDHFDCCTLIFHFQRILQFKKNKNQS